MSCQKASGQLIDLITAPIGVVDLSTSPEEAYMRIVTYKTAFYTFYLPAASAMRLSGIEDEQAYKVANDICVKLGQFFQIQDDYLDCYGDPKVIGKIGTDIKDNKCGWLVVQALKKCTAEQRKIIEENYGKDDAECEKKIQTADAKWRSSMNQVFTTPTCRGRVWSVEATFVLRTPC